jgi:hypothetical protein
MESCRKGMHDMIKSNSSGYRVYIGADNKTDQAAKRRDKKPGSVCVCAVVRDQQKVLAGLGGRDVVRWA